MLVLMCRGGLGFRVAGLGFREVKHVGRLGHLGLRTQGLEGLGFRM